MANSLMDIKETAAYLKMNKMTIYKLAREGAIPAFKVASEWRFKKEIIDQWLIGQLKDKPKLKELRMLDSGGSRTTILIVDDEEVIQEYFEKVLTGYRVLKASSGQDALSLMAKDKPDLVLLDIRMPGIDGIETLKRIKAFDANIVVIMLSAFGDMRTNLEAAQLGAYTSLAKPFDLAEMKKIIDDACVQKNEGFTKPGDHS